MGSFLQDLRYTLRSLVAAPLFTAAVLLILALGIGATSAIFSVVNGLLLSPLPFDEPERLNRVAGVRRTSGSARPLSYLDFVELRDRNTVYSELAVHSGQVSLNLAVDGIPESVIAEMVSANLFKTLGVEPVQGRIMSEEEERPGAAQRVVLLSDAFWERRFGRDPEMLGRSLLLNDLSYQVVGVLPEGFRGVTDRADIWLPIGLSAEVYNPSYIEDRALRWLASLGRLKPGVSLRQASSAMATLGEALEEQFPDENYALGIKVTDLTEFWFGNLRAPLLTLQAASLLVLLIVSTNIANLLLARALRRERDVAIRMALGAPRRRLVQQFLTESLTLAFVGSLLGLAIAYYGTRALMGLGALQLRSFVDIRLDPTVVAATVLVALLCGLGFGLAPVFLSFRINLAGTLKEGGRGTGGAGRGRMRRAFVVVEVALAVMLLLGAGLIIKSFRMLHEIELGFEPRELMTMRMDLLGESYVEETERWQVAQQFLEELKSVPGLASFALSSPGGVPTGGLVGHYFTIEDRVLPDPNEDTLLLPFHCVSPDYFETLGTEVLEGRTFTSQDRKGALPVMVITRSVAERFWGDKSPIGARIRDGFRESNENPWYTIVGVVADIAYEGRTRTPELDTPSHIYLPLMQMAPAYPPRMHLLARSDRVTPSSLVSPIRQTLKRVAPTLPIHHFATVEDLLGDQVSRDRLTVFLMSLFAVLALILAVVGIYAIIAYHVQQHSREIGLRMALGATGGAVMRLLLTQALRMVAIGLILGLIVALALGRYLKSVLFGVEPFDPLIYFLTVIFFLAVALVASYVPTRAALRIHPATTLQAE